MVERTVIVGGSIARLLTAAALHGHCHDVIVVERDDIPDDPRPRAGVPRPQVHALLAIGAQTMDKLLPGLTADLVAFGSVPMDAAGALQARVDEWIRSGAQITNADPYHIPDVLRPMIVASQAPAGPTTGARGSE